MQGSLTTLALVMTNVTPSGRVFHLRMTRDTILMTVDKDYGKAEQGKEGEELSHDKAAKSITQYEGNLISTVEERKATYSWLLFI